ncbi:MAG: outer membrane protein assembly factor BamA [Myxococcales bacterium]|nr:outer membrane protein assembly factor BamA [Myxococcales bacterium]
MILRRAFTCLLLSVAVAAPSALAQETDAPIEEPAQKITELRVEGNRRVEQAAIARALKQKVGEPFDATKTADDLRALWALKYFNDVQLLVQRTPDGVVYVVRVEEKPAVRAVTLSGNDELSKDDLKDTIDIKTNSILDLSAIKRNVKKVSDKYVEKGYFLAEVTSQVRPVEGSPEVDVVIVIKENAKVQVKELNFLGVEKVPVAELKAVMATKEGGYLSFLTSEGTYREELFQRDLQVIQAAYYDRGFINVRVDKPVVSLSPDKRNISITLRIEEGEPYKIGKLDFSGDLIITKDEFKARMTSREGEIFNRSLLARDIQAITDVYYDSGFAYANPVPVTAVNADSKTIDLTFDVNKGKQVTIERIDIVGNTKTRDKVIRRQLRVYEGELFSGTGMRRSKEKVTALGFFETVEVTHKPGRDDEHVLVMVEVKEKSTGTFQVGLGFSNIESFIFTAQVAQQNFVGWGQAVSFSAQLSGLRQFFQASYFDPYFLDTNFIFSLDAYRTQLDFFGFVRDAYGGTASLGYYVIADEMSFNLGYTREFVRVEPSRSSLLLADQFRSGNTSAARLGWLWDKRNNRLFPSQGWFMNVTAEFAPRALGGSYIFNRYTGNFRGYVPLPLGIVFKAQLQLGIIQQLEPANGLPASELYYLGGIFTVRGYPIRTISPTELAAASPDGVTQQINVGGDRQLFLNVELEFPIFEKVGIRGVLFYDAGNAFARGVPFFQDRTYPNLPLGLFHAVGFGFRWFSPIGPLRFEWGFPLNRRQGIDLQVPQFEFTIGQSF